MGQRGPIKLRGLLPGMCSREVLGAGVPPRELCGGALLMAQTLTGRQVAGRNLV